MTRDTFGPSSDGNESGFRATECNRGTILPWSGRDIVSELAMRVVAEAHALRTHFMRPEPADSRVVARVALLGVDSLATHGLAADPDAFICVGRHEQASLQAPHAESLSLRHVLLIPTLMEKGSDVQVDVIPLSPTVEARAWALPLPPPLDEMCTAMLLGDALLLVAPAPSGTPMSLNLGPGAASGLERQRPAVARARQGAAVRTRVTSIFGLSSLPEVKTNAAFVLKLRSPTQCAAVGLQTDWLTRGIVLGRSEAKCSHAALAQLLSYAWISRCHVFVRREGDSLVFYDTASTWGMFVDAVRVRRYVLPALPSHEGDSNEHARDRKYVSLPGNVSATVYAV